jgi:hypothetical protein
MCTASLSFYLDVTIFGMANENIWIAQAVAVILRQKYMYSNSAHAQKKKGQGEFHIFRKPIYY